MSRTKKLAFIDTLVVGCAILISFLVLRYLRSEFNGVERVFAYLIFISTAFVVLRGLHTLIHGKAQIRKEESESTFRE
jgi:multisubunit Na+/H+ antiporter MnhB subunit